MLYECIVCFLLVLQLQIFQSKVECLHAFGSLENTFGSFESEIKSQYRTSIKPHYFEIDRAEIPAARPRHNKHKKSKKAKKKPHKYKQNDAKAKRKSEKKKYAKRFEKVRDDSLSKSRETAKAKPVDIIVHIKMNE